MRQRERYTQKQVRNFLSHLGAKLRTNQDDYTLVIGKGDDEQTYFSDSLEDIVGTAGVMLGSHPLYEEAMESELGVKV